MLVVRCSPDLFFSSPEPRAARLVDEAPFALLFMERKLVPDPLREILVCDMAAR